MEATTVRSLATTIMTKMTAVNSQQPLLDLHLPVGVPGVPSLPAQSNLMDTARKHKQDFVVIQPVVILRCRRTGSVASLLAKHPTRFQKKRDRKGPKLVQKLTHIFMFFSINIIQLC